MPSTHLPAIFDIDSTSRRQIVFLPLRERRSLVCSASTLFDITAYVSPPPLIILFVLCIAIKTNLPIYSICTLMGRVLCVLRILGRQGLPRGVSSRSTYYWGTYLSSYGSLLSILLSLCHFYFFFRFLH